MCLITEWALNGNIFLNGPIYMPNKVQLLGMWAAAHLQLIRIAMVGTGKGLEAHKAFQ